MKKFFFSLVAATMAATGTVFAQSSLLATLSHEGNISAYYGADALKTAMAEAEAGDIITLSSGQFNAVDINKPITLRGAGMSVMADSVSTRQPTVIDGSLEIKIDESQSSRLLLEGIYFSSVTYDGTIKNAQFLKCRFYSFIPSADAKIVNSSFIHCRINNGFTMNSNSSNAYFINSLVCNPINDGTFIDEVWYQSTSNIEFDNCFVKFDYFLNNDYSVSKGVRPDYCDNAYYKNCIIQEVRGSYKQMYSDYNLLGTAYNCIGFSNYSGANLFKYMSPQNTTNKTVDALSDLFKTYSETSYDSYIKDSDDFTLTDEAAAQYLGTDGTQVGIYGGNLPYNEEISIPQITKCNVASKSSADGKLSVDIEVKAAEY
ncbi:MAG: hypothetical protein IKR50_03885 [Prevotella sp.]|nr:hypothetical protein [Prevotella sp.]